MDFLSSLSSRDQLNWYHSTQIPPQQLNQPITIFHPRDGKSPLAHLPLAPWLLTRHLVQAYSDTRSILFLTKLPVLMFFTLITRALVKITKNGRRRQVVADCHHVMANCGCSYLCPDQLNHLYYPLCPLFSLPI
jgi:hypothetical protein